MATHKKKKIKAELFFIFFLCVALILFHSIVSTHFVFDLSLWTLDARFRKPYLASVLTQPLGSLASSQTDTHNRQMSSTFSTKRISTYTLSQRLDGTSVIICTQFKN